MEITDIYCNWEFDIDDNINDVNLFDNFLCIGIWEGWKKAATSFENGKMARPHVHRTQERNNSSAGAPLSALLHHYQENGKL